MKIVCIDNFNRDTVSDVLVAENVPEQYAEHIAKNLNWEFSGDYASSYFVVRPDDYQLYRWEP